MIRKNKKEEYMKIILKAHATIKRMPDITIDYLKLFSQKEIEELLEIYEMVLALESYISSKYIKILSDEALKDEKITIKKINLYDLFNSL